MSALYDTLAQVNAALAEYRASKQNAGQTDPPEREPTVVRVGSNMRIIETDAGGQVETFKNGVWRRQQVWE